MNAFKKFYLVPENELNSRHQNRNLELVSSAYEKVLAKQSELDHKKELKASTGIYEGLEELLSSSIDNRIKMCVFNDILHRHLDKVKPSKVFKPKEVEKQEQIDDKVDQKSVDDRPTSLHETESEWFDAAEDLTPKRKSKEALLLKHKVIGRNG